LSARRRKRRFPGGAVSPVKYRAAIEANTFRAARDRHALRQQAVKLCRIRAILPKLPRFIRRQMQMTELEILARNIHALKELLRVAWKDLANPSLTSFERREARNQINEYSAELRRHLQLIEAERNRSSPSGANAGAGFRETKFRILA
jgi:hypothetical protein